MFPQDPVGLRSPGSFKKALLKILFLEGRPGVRNKHGRVGVHRPAIEVAVPTPEPVELEGATRGHTQSSARREQGQGTGLRAPHPPISSPAPPAGQESPSQAGSKGGGTGRCSLQGRLVCGLRAGEQRWG